MATVFCSDKATFLSFRTSAVLLTVTTLAYVMTALVVVFSVLAEIALVIESELPRPLEG